MEPCFARSQFRGGSGWVVGVRAWWPELKSRPWIPQVTFFSGPRVCRPDDLPAIWTQTNLPQRREAELLGTAWRKEEVRPCPGRHVSASEVSSAAVLNYHSPGDQKWSLWRHQSSLYIAFMRTMYLLCVCAIETPRKGRGWGARFGEQVKDVTPCSCIEEITTHVKAASFDLPDYRLAYGCVFLGS